MVVEIAARREAVLPAWERIAAVISLAVVLPLLPATPTTGMSKASRHALPRARERRLRVGDDDLRQGERLRRIDERAGRAGRQRRADELVAVEARTAQGDEQIARRQRAPVARDAGEGAVGALEPAAAGLREIPQRPLDCRLPLMAASPRAPRAPRSDR